MGIEEFEDFREGGSTNSEFISTLNIKRQNKGEQYTEIIMNTPSYPKQRVT